MTELLCGDILVLGHMPPPITGVSVINRFIVDELEGRGRLAKCVNLTPACRRGGAIYGIARLWLALCAILEIRNARRNGISVVYLPLDGGVGIIFNCLLAIAAKFSGFRVFVHHHSFSYINNGSWLMALLLLCLPMRTTHVFLCEGMAQRFVEGYPWFWSRSKAKTFILNNGFLLEFGAGRSRLRSPGDDFVLGHLSNLCAEKGTHLVLDLFERMLEKGSGVSVVLAGPILEDDLWARIERLKKEHGDLITWLGLVTGSEKTKFFEAIDLFVFPTLYKHEAQPLVLLEALGYGVPIVSMRRGCIAFDYDETVGVLADGAEDFLPEATRIIEDILADSLKYDRLCKAALSKALKQSALARTGLAKLFALMGESKNAA